MATPSSLVPIVNASAQKPGIRQRLEAVAVIVLVALVIAASVESIVEDLRRFLVQGTLLLTAMFAAWYALTRVGGRRVIGVVICLAALAGIVGDALAEEGNILLLALLRLVLLVLAVALARSALASDVRSLRRAETPGIPVAAATRGVLIMNTKSGGGKAERFHLVDECHKRGIEPVVLRPGDDLLQLAQVAIDGGADVIGMAGGDGSQALVASVAAERGVPMVVVPAGTRNHLALDLGLDREDVVGALDAFGEARERPMDLAEVNGRVFVNNVSLGLYAAIVRSPAYRDAKVDTTLATLPKVLGPGTRPFDLRFTGPDGERHEGAHLIQISNNPYGKTKTVDSISTRPRLDTKRLGVLALEIADDRAAAAFLTAVAAGHLERFAGFTSWTPETFQVTSDSPIDVGLDGESLSMDSPMSFSILREPLRVRLPKHAIGYSPAARSVGWRSACRGVWQTALGKQPVSRSTRTRRRSPTPGRFPARAGR
ncbi:MAG: diacylglycerol/lipid kinase family protein [Actinomycetota bacterium]